MKRLSRRAVCAGLTAVAASCAGPSRQPAIVTTFTILSDIARALAGEAATIVSIVGFDADAHVFEPSPADAARVSEAALLIENGLGFEPWVQRLKSASLYGGPACVAADGVGAIRRAAAIDPHAWHDVANVRLYAQQITSGLRTAFGDDGAMLDARLTAYEQMLAALDGDIRARISAIPEDRRVVVTSHDAFGYFERAYGVRFLAPIGLSTDEEPRPDRVAALIDQIRREGVRALFLENMSDPRLLQSISAETGVRIGGRLYSDALTSSDGPAATYEMLMRTNLERVASALE